MAEQTLYLCTPNRIATFLLIWALTTLSSTARAEEPERRFQIGVGIRYMPTGWFVWSGKPGEASPNPRAYPALGLAPFLDYRLNRFVSIGLTPEFTANVIPRVIVYPISMMLTGALRLKLEHPGLHTVVPYALLAPGYSFLFGCCTDGVASGDSHGFVASAYAGVRIPIGARHSIFAEGGYMHGFQKDGGRDYAPSYVVLALGWQMSR
jgi:hypothetical protein